MIWSGSSYQPLPTMPIPAPVHRRIAGVVQPPETSRSTLLVDVSHAPALGTTVQFTGVPGGDNDTVRHPPDCDHHPAGKSPLRYPFGAQ